MYPEHATSNFSLLFPYLEKVEANNGYCSFQSSISDKPVLGIENLCTITYSIRIYRMYYADEKIKEAEFVTDLYRSMIFPLRFFSIYLNEDIQCKVFQTSLRNNERADMHLWLWIRDLPLLGYTADKFKKQTHKPVSQPEAVKSLNRDLPQMCNAVNKIEKKDLNIYKTKPVKPLVTKRVSSSTQEYYSRDISFDGPDHTLYICKGTIACQRKYHKILSATGILVSLNQTPVKINVNYCTVCRKYFLNLVEYKHYQEKYGNLLGNYAFEDAVSSGGNGFDDLAEKSVLNLCGYNVNSENNLSEKDRWLILENLMDHNIVSKPKIIEYLTFFISSKKNKKNMKFAVQKWTADLEWVRQYRINSQRRFLISNIKIVR